MRIATWNLERAGSAPIRQAQSVVLRDLAADIIVLTEPGPAYQSAPGIVTSPPARMGRKGKESWVAIVGPSVEPVTVDIPFERMAVAGTTRVNDVPLVIYGSVLPWGFIRTNAPDLSGRTRQPRSIPTRASRADGGHRAASAATP